MRRHFIIVSSALACVFMLSTAGQAASSRKPQRAVEPAKVATAKPAPAGDRSKLFAPDTGVDKTATVASSGLKHGCGSIACKNYTIMGVGF